MKLGVGVLFVALGLLVLWAATTGKLSRLPQAWSALKGDAPDGVTPTSGPAATGTAARVAAALNVPAGFPQFPVVPFAPSLN